jgi:hypothetical protein
MGLFLQKKITLFVIILEDYVDRERLAVDLEEYSPLGDLGCFANQTDAPRRKVNPVVERTVDALNWPHTATC